MMTADPKPPQTFEEWRDYWNAERSSEGVSEMSTDQELAGAVAWDAAFAAGVASQQAAGELALKLLDGRAAQIDQLKAQLAEKEAEIERLALNHDDERSRRVNAEIQLARYEAVVEAARDFYVDMDGDSLCDAWNGTCTCSTFRLRAALAKLEKP